MNAQLHSLRQRVVEQAVLNPDHLGESLTFESNAAAPINFNGVLIRKTRKPTSGDEGIFDRFDATLLMSVTDYKSLQAAVTDFRDDGWVTHDSEKFYFVGDTDNNGVTITALLSRTQFSALGRAYPRTAGRASHK